MLLLVFPMSNERNIGCGVLSGKMLPLRIVENNEIDAYFRAG